MKFISKFHRTQSPCAISQHHLEVSPKTLSPKTHVCRNTGRFGYTAYNTSTYHDKHLCISYEAQTLLGYDYTQLH
ncbi:hypothetical protein MTR_3g437400 [Medicago truncatula]|uniref:Uncharacterized protein n=1 Tax=Medicago truncatula TaxID=3880 RepID=A0A072UVI6_MEDTR|nr:hypothetical protein MTR_3g437400 [Medicago truncatula]